MYIPGRQSSRHMKGHQVAMTLYLPPKKYWLLKWLSRKRGVSMQALLREAIDEVLENTAGMH